MNNVSGMNFYKNQNKHKLVQNLNNNMNDFDIRSSSAIDTRVNSLGKKGGVDDKIVIGIPKLFRNKFSHGSLDIVKSY